MKTKVSILFTFFVSLLITTNCQTNRDFKNVIEIIPENCKKNGLPEVHFKISYPTDENIRVRVLEKNSSNYVQIDYLSPKLTILEEISIGYCKECKLENKQIILEYTKQLYEEFKKYVKVVNFSVAEEKILGEKAIVGNYKIESDTTFFESFEPGIYYWKTIILREKSVHSNGVLIFIIASPKTKVKKCKDILTKSKLAKTIKTFRFL